MFHRIGPFRKPNAPILKKHTVYYGCADIPPTHVAHNIVKQRLSQNEKLKRNEKKDNKLKHRQKWKNEKYEKMEMVKYELKASIHCRVSVNADMDDMIDEMVANKQT